MRFARTGLDAEGLEQRFAHQVRHLAVCAAKAKIHVRLAKPDRQQLGVTIRKVEQMHVAVARQIVETLAIFGGEQVAGI